MELILREKKYIYFGLAVGSNHGGDCHRANPVGIKTVTTLAGLLVHIQMPILILGRYKAGRFEKRTDMGLCRTINLFNPIIRPQQ